MSLRERQEIQEVLFAVSLGDSGWLKHFPRSRELSCGMRMRIFLTRIYSEITTPVYTVWEDPMERKLSGLMCRRRSG